MRGVLLVAALTLAPALLAGCLGDGLSLTGRDAQSGDPRLALLDDDVRPTGRVREFTLYLHRMDHEPYPDATMQMWAFSLSEEPGSATVPGPELRVTEGDTVRVTFRPLVPNFPHTVHFHGQHVPWEMDGTPYVAQEPVPAGGEFTYEFIAKPSGTYWYHCHYDAQHHIDMGMYGAFIVEPQDKAADPPFSREYTLMLDEMDRFHLEGGNPNPGNLPQDGDPFTYEEWARRQSRDIATRNQQVEERVTGSPARPTRSWFPETLAPYTADYNTFLINGASFPYTEPLLIGAGEVVRIRLVNVGNEMHAMHLHGHHVLVTHKDGRPLASPYLADTVAIAPGERYDVYVKGTNPGVWDFHDHFTHTNVNDNIWPGGMMTLLAYEEYADRVEGLGHGHGAHSGDLLRMYIP
ncbi:MAG TPA: multicopper oxidase domain-containing protein [Candidatus Thermoplasmatota archaeon]|nr:multicopper oxidase domain-containing protein [Candidatus Thermoplasmatota archaeon]